MPNFVYRTKLGICCAYEAKISVCPVFSTVGFFLDDLPYSTEAAEARDKNEKELAAALIARANLYRK